MPWPWWWKQGYKASEAARSLNGGYRKVWFPDNCVGTVRVGSDLSIAQKVLRLYLRRYQVMGGVKPGEPLAVKEDIIIDLEGLKEKRMLNIQFDFLWC